MPPLTRIQYFYQDHELQTAVTAGCASTLVRCHKTTVAQTRGPAGQAIVGLLATDMQGSILCLDEAKQNYAFAYSAYGHTPIGNLSILGFGGQRPDLQTRSYLLGNGHRVFHPSLSRLFSSDRLSPFARGGINSYSYCDGDPINFTDPSGKARSPNLIWQGLDQFEPRITLPPPPPPPQRRLANLEPPAQPRVDIQIPERSPPPPAAIPLQLRSHALAQPAAVMVASTPALTALSPQAAPPQRLPVIARWINRMGNWMSNLRFRQPRPPTAMRATTPSTLGLHLASRRYAQAQRGSNSNYMSNNNRDIRR